MAKTITIHHPRGHRLAISDDLWRVVDDCTTNVTVTAESVAAMLADDRLEIDTTALGVIGASLAPRRHGAADLAQVSTFAGRYVWRDSSGLWATTSDADGARMLGQILGAGGQDRRTAAWRLPTDPSGCARVVGEMAPLGFGWSPDAQAFIAANTTGKVAAAGPRVVVGPSDEELAVLGGELLAYQREGVQYLRDHRRVLLADSMGLGKTAQALATIGIEQAFPLVVVCPASLRINWQREARSWLPGRFAVVVNSKKRHNFQGADVIIMSYEVVTAHLDAITALKPKAAIFDESHYLKDRKAKRTVAAKGLVRRLDADPMVLALTGTPVVNRPVELAGQLEVLGRLDELGGFWPFAQRYCDAKQTQWGWDLSGSSNSDELVERLRSVCYLRRRQSDVALDLPPRRDRTVTVEVDLDAALTMHTADGVAYQTTYRQLEEDFVATMVRRATDIASSAGADVAAAAVTAELAAEAREHFGKVHDLHHAAGVVKVNHVVKWATDLLESKADDNAKLVLFAHHRDVLESLDAALTEFGSGLVWGGQSAKLRQQAIDRFDRDPASRVLVCSLKAAGFGLNLVAAADLGFAQPLWTPADMAQATARIDRMGQTRPTTAWHLVAAGTVEERVYRLLDAKSLVIDRATDGVAGQGVLTDVVVQYATNTR